MDKSAMFDPSQLRSSWSDYVRLVWRGAAWLLAAGVLTVLGGIETATDINLRIPGWAWFTFAGLCLVVAQFLAFHRMRVERDAEATKRAELEADLKKAEANQGPTFVRMEDSHHNVISGEMNVGSGMGVAPPLPSDLPPELLARIQDAYRRYILWATERDATQPEIPRSGDAVPEYMAREREHRQETQRQFLTEHYPRLSAVYNQLKERGYGHREAEIALHQAYGSDRAIPMLAKPFALLAGQAELQEDKRSDQAGA